MRTSMHTMVKAGTIGIAGLVGAGLLSLGVAGASASDAAYTRAEDDTEVVTTVDDDDDDTARRDATGTRADTRDTRTGRDQTATRDSRDSGVSRDQTNSRFSRVSRDRDQSRGDLTRDWTRDGAGQQQRDVSANSTNDRSRNDTRRR